MFSTPGTKGPVAIVPRAVDNPSDGNCAPYSFAIGLMDIIQYESQYHCRDMFDRWCKLDPSIADLYQDICACPLIGRLPKSPMLTRLQASIRQLSLQTQSRALQAACADLRECRVHLVSEETPGEAVDQKPVLNGREILILSNADGYSIGYRNVRGEYEQKAIDDKDLIRRLRAHKPPSYINESSVINGVDELLSTEKYRATALTWQKYKQLLGSDIFVLFSGAYYKNMDSDLSRSEGITKALDTLRVKLNGLNEDEKQAGIVRAFLTLLYGERESFDDLTPETPFDPGSPLVAVLNLLTKPFHWIYFQDIYVLAPLFQVNFHPMVNGEHIQEYKDDPKMPVITVENIGRGHFQTHVVVAESTSGSGSDHRYDMGGTPPPKPTRTISSDGGPEKAADDAAAKKTADDAAAKKTAAEAAAKRATAEAEAKKAADEAAAKRATAEAAAKKAADEAAAKKAADEAAAKKTADEATAKNTADEAAAKKAVDEAAAKKTADELSALKQKVNDVTVVYINYNKSVPFSFFHRHGATGRRRAEEFLNSILTLDSIDEVKTKLITFLQDKTQGNTHPHSYRTMLLEQLGNSPKQLKLVSQQYADMLNQLNSSYDSDRINHGVRPTV